MGSFCGRFPVKVSVAIVLTDIVRDMLFYLKIAMQL